MHTIPMHLKSILDLFEGTSVDGVPGVMCIESSVPGPVLGITACTHGNEPSGLAIFENLLSSRDIANVLQRGTLYLVLNNIEAAKNYFAAMTELEIHHARYVHVNMNRLPKDVLARTGDTRYEVLRTQELYPIWKRFTVGLDVHTPRYQALR